MSQTARRFRSKRNARREACVSNLQSAARCYFDAYGMDEMPLQLTRSLRLRIRGEQAMHWLAA